MSIHRTSRKFYSTRFTENINVMRKITVQFQLSTKYIAEKLYTWHNRKED
jgi:hypothetical protein